MDALTMDESIDEAIRLIETRQSAQHVVVNAAKLVAAVADDDLRAIIDGCSIVNADGQAVVWASRLLGCPLPERVTGIDFMNRLVDVAAQRGYGIFLLGAEPDVLAAVEEEFVRRGASVVGRADGFWRRHLTDKELVNEIAQLQPDILFVALPSPMKENFLAENLRQIPTGLCVGVGGSFDVIAGRTQRAPAWMQRSGIEWFFRLVQEPRRMFKRYLVGNTKFIYYVLREWTSQQAVRRRDHS
ncbi:WecB/TagA/CpsF family glycosyltransferase [Paeniglutamicibacter sp. ORCA_105]|uniref:WecB/TagA/CpsF family glycosyltransferase n=1 Tax=Paeniglutamicibacter sp. ORCA_105 TaxID=3377336 RepID=UPI0038937568